jgi:hypothetical protein
MEFFRLNRRSQGAGQRGSGRFLTMSERIERSKKFGPSKHDPGWLGPGKGYR